MEERRYYGVKLSYAGYWFESNQGQNKKENNMPRIPIIDKQAKPSVPNNKELNTRQERYHPTGRPPLPLNKSFSPQAKKQKQNSGEM